MRVFVRPLIIAIYGTEESTAEDLTDLIRLFASPQAETARRNLLDLAVKLDLELTAIPQFIADYGDIYLSLAYYQSCLDIVSPTLSEFLEILRELKRNDLVKRDVSLIQGCTQVEARLEGAAIQVSAILENFRDGTENMWDDISASRFRSLVKMITSYQAKIGGGLCALTVKLNEWRRQFPSPEHEGPQSSPISSPPRCARASS